MQNRNASQQARQLHQLLEQEPPAPTRARNEGTDALDSMSYDELVDYLSKSQVGHMAERQELAQTLPPLEEEEEYQPLPGPYAGYGAGAEGSNEYYDYGDYPPYSADYPSYPEEQSAEWDDYYAQEAPPSPYEWGLYDLEGYDQEGYDQEGYDRQGYDRQGFDREGYDRGGFDRDGYDQEGYTRQDWLASGYTFAPDGSFNMDYAPAPPQSTPAPVPPRVELPELDEEPPLPEAEEAPPVEEADSEAELALEANPMQERAWSQTAQTKEGKRLTKGELLAHLAPTPANKGLPPAESAAPQPPLPPTPAPSLAPAEKPQRPEDLPVYDLVKRAPVTSEPPASPESPAPPPAEESAQEYPPQAQDYPESAPYPEEDYYPQEEAEYAPLEEEYASEKGEYAPQEGYDSSDYGAEGQEYPQEEEYASQADYAQPAEYESQAEEYPPQEGEYTPEEGEYPAPYAQEGSEYAPPEEEYASEEGEYAPQEGYESPDYGTEGQEYPPEEEYASQADYAQPAEYESQTDYAYPEAYPEDQEYDSQGYYEESPEGYSEAEGYDYYPPAEEEGQYSEEGYASPEYADQEEGEREYPPSEYTDYAEEQYPAEEEYATPAAEEAQPFQGAVTQFDATTNLDPQSQESEPEERGYEVRTLRSGPGYLVSMSREPFPMVPNGQAPPTIGTQADGSAPCDFVFDYVAGPNKGLKVALAAYDLGDEKTLYIGKPDPQGRDNDIEVTGPKAANDQALLRYNRGRFTLENFQEEIKVNRREITCGEQVNLMTGDEIVIDSNRLVFRERAVSEMLDQYYLEVTEGIESDLHNRFPLERQRTSIGRNRNADVILTDQEVSRSHCTLTLRNQRFYLQHRSDTFPTYINGVAVPSGREREVNPGDEIKVSSRTILQLRKKGA